MDHRLSPDTFSPPDMQLPSQESKSSLSDITSDIRTSSSLLNSVASGKSDESPRLRRSGKGRPGRSASVQILDNVIMSNNTKDGRTGSMFRDAKSKVGKAVC